MAARFIPELDSSQILRQPLLGMPPVIEDEEEESLLKRFGTGLFDALAGDVIRWAQAEGQRDKERFQDMSTKEKVLSALPIHTGSAQEYIAESGPLNKMLFNVEDDKIKYDPEGARAAFDIATTLYGGPRLLTKGGATVLGTSAALPALLTGATGGDMGDVAEATGRGIGAAPQIMGLTRATDPTIYKAMQHLPETGGVMGLANLFRQPQGLVPHAAVQPSVRAQAFSRAMSGFANVVQGNLIDKAREQETSLGWQMFDFLTGAAFGKEMFRPWITARGEVDPDLFSDYLSRIGFQVRHVENLTAPIAFTRVSKSALRRYEGFPETQGQIELPETGRILPSQFGTISTTAGEEFVEMYAANRKLPGPGSFNAEHRVAIPVSTADLNLKTMGTDEFAKFQEDPTKKLDKRYDGFLLTGNITRGGREKTVMARKDVADRLLKESLADRTLSKVKSNVSANLIKGRLPARATRPMFQPSKRKHVFPFEQELAGKEHVPVQWLQEKAAAQASKKEEKAAINDALKNLPDNVFSEGKGATEKYPVEEVVQKRKVQYDPKTQTKTEIQPEIKKTVYKTRAAGSVNVKALTDYVHGNHILEDHIRLGRGFNKSYIEKYGGDVRDMMRKVPGYNELADDGDIADVFFPAEITNPNRKSLSAIGRWRWFKESSMSDSTVRETNSGSFYPGYNKEPSLDIFKDNGMENANGMLDFAIIFETDDYMKAGYTSGLSGNHGWTTYTHGYGGHARVAMIPFFNVAQYMDQLPKEMQLSPQEVQKIIDRDGAIRVMMVLEGQEDSKQQRDNEIQAEKLYKGERHRRPRPMHEIYADLDMAEKSAAKEKSRYLAEKEFVRRDIPIIMNKINNKRTLEVVQTAPDEWSVRTKDRFGEATDIDGLVDIKRLQGLTRGPEPKSVKMLSGKVEAKRYINALKDNPELQDKFFVGTQKFTNFDPTYHVYRKRPTEQGFYDSFQDTPRAGGGTRDYGSFITDTAKYTNQKFTTRAEAEEYYNSITNAAEYMSDKVAEHARNLPEEHHSERDREVLSENLILAFQRMLRRFTTGRGITMERYKEAVDSVNRSIQSVDRLLKGEYMDFQDSINEHERALNRNPHQEVLKNKIEPLVNNFEWRQLKELLALAEDVGAHYMAFPYAETGVYSQGHLSFHPGTRAKPFVPRDIRKNIGKTTMLPVGDPGETRKMQRVVVLKDEGDSLRYVRLDNPRVKFFRDDYATSEIATRIMGQIRVGGDALETVPKKYRDIYNKSMNKKDFNRHFYDYMKEDWGYDKAELLTTEDYDNLYDRFKEGQDGSMETYLRSRWFDPLTNEPRDHAYDLSLEGEYGGAWQYEITSSNLSEVISNFVHDKARHVKRRALRDEINKLTFTGKIRLMQKIQDAYGKGKIIPIKETMDSYGDLYGVANNAIVFIARGAEETVLKDDIKNSYKFDWKKDVPEGRQPIYHRYARSEKKNSFPYLLDKHGIANAVITGSNRDRYELIPTSSLTKRSIKGFQNFKGLRRLLPILMLPFLLSLLRSQEEMPEQPEEL
jgi:hypothetical protein